MAYLFATQLTETLVTLAPATVPEPFETAQLWPEGCRKTVTKYALPLVSGVLKVNGPSAVMARSSPPLLRSTSPVPVRPLTAPPTVYLGGGLVMQDTETLVTLALATVPEPFETPQVCPEGWLATVTA